MRDAERWSEHTRRLPPLQVGDQVRIQNQIGPHPTKWDKTGTVVEVRQFDQYVLRVDGSGRVTLRNRKFLRRFTPFGPPRPFNDVPPPVRKNNLQLRQIPPLITAPTQPSDETPPTPTPIQPAQNILPTEPETLPAAPTPPTPTHSVPLRRSTRDRKQPAWLKDYET